MLARIGWPTALRLSNPNASRLRHWYGESYEDIADMKERYMDKSGSEASSTNSPEVWMASKD